MRAFRVSRFGIWSVVAALHQYGARRLVRAEVEEVLPREVREVLTGEDGVVRDLEHTGSRSPGASKASCADGFVPRHAGCDARVLSGCTELWHQAGKVTGVLQLLSRILLSLC